MFIFADIAKKASDEKGKREISPKQQKVEEELSRFIDVRSAGR